MPSQPSFWMPGSPTRNLSVTSLPSPALRKRGAGNRQRLACAAAVVPSAAVPGELERRDGGVVDLAEVVVDARDLEPLGVGRHHPPRHEVVERGAPQHRLLAAGVHRDVAADARGVGGRRIDGEHEARGLGGVHHAARDHAGARVDRRHAAAHGRRARCARPPRARSSFSVLITAERGVERNRAAGVAGAAAARNDREAELDAALDERRAPRPRCPDRARRTDTRRASRWRR